jgi:hypothetical protein
MTRWRLCAFVILALMLPIVTGIYARPANSATACQQQTATCLNKCGDGIIIVNWSQIDCKNLGIGGYSTYCAFYLACGRACYQQARNCDRNVITDKPPSAGILDSGPVVSPKGPARTRTPSSR